MKALKRFLLGFLVLSVAVSSAFSASAKDVLKGKEGVFAVITTEKGEIVLNLFYKETPMTVANFVGLAEGTLDAAKGKPYYNGLKFHRVIANFMIQGGDPNGTGTGGPGYSFPDEFVDGLVFDKPGLLAMANSGKDTNGSQFFITHVPTTWLNYQHTIFGEVLAGQDVVNAVAQDDHMTSIEIIRQGKEAEAFKVTQESFNKLKEEGKTKISAFRAKQAEATLKSVILGCKKTDSGIYYKTLRAGKGSKAGKNKKVTIDYRVYTVAGPETVFGATKAFDSRGGAALEFTTGKHELIEGVDEMVQDMQVGETRYMVIPGDLGYGPAGGIPELGIAADDYICFDVTLVK